MKILLVDDHIVVREGVRRLLASLIDSHVWEAATGQEAMAVFRREKPDVVLLDLNLAGVGGFEILRRMIAEDERARVIVFSMHAEPIYVVRALGLGARGYVSKSAAAEELVTAVNRVADGGRYIERHLADELAFSQDGAQFPLQDLTAREIDILRLLGEGNALMEIAQALGIAYKTVANSCSVMKTKLGVARTADLIRVDQSQAHVPRIGRTAGRNRAKENAAPTGERVGAASCVAVFGVVGLIAVCT